MALIDHTLFGVEDKVAIAIERIRTFEPQCDECGGKGWLSPAGRIQFGNLELVEIDCWKCNRTGKLPYYVAFSGGKDSCVILDLVKRAGVQFDAHYNLTTVDPPELVHFIRREYPEVEVRKPEKTMWQLIEDHGMPPLRQVRYCCKELKETGGGGRVVITGVRWAESVRRAKRRMTEQCMRDASRTYLHPIIDWTETDVWNYIHGSGLPHCSLYDEGWKRIGCVMCPMGGSKQMKKQAERWPKIAAAYKRACCKAIEHNKPKGMNRQQSGEEMYEWWISGSSMKGDDDQTVLFE
jgi:phosphoadenosine phosphosulfate reductase